MTVIDRYIARQFLINFAILLTVLLSMFVAIDLLVDVDEFVQAGRTWATQRLASVEADRRGLDPAALGELARAGADAAQLQAALPIDRLEAARLHAAIQPGWVTYLMGLGGTVIGYYGPLLVLIYTFICGLVVVGAIGFTFAGMVRSRELTALLAGGVSVYRVAAPVIVVGAMLNLLNLPLQEGLIPAFAENLARPKHELKEGRRESFPIFLSPDGQGRLLTAARFDPEEAAAEDVVFLERDDQGVARRRVVAERALWDPEAGGWSLIGGLGIALTPDDLSEPEPVPFIESSLTPEVLAIRRAASYPRFLPVTGLQELLVNPAVEPQQRRLITSVIWSRFSMLIVGILLMLVALPYFLPRAPQANLLTAAVRASGVIVLGWGAAMVCTQAGTVWLSPMAAVWLPVAVLGPLAIGSVATLRS